jgi:TATA-box binding protein (TBP) (component of TFIID and TFIIIB)
MEILTVPEFKSTPLTISTCTVLCNLNKRLNLELITRFVPVNELQSPELNEKSGGLYNIEFYGNCARGETMTEKINEMFNNQTTIKFKYWGFRMVNIKIFRNGRLQMTGLKYEEEASLLANLLINIISKISIPINQTPQDIINSNRTYDMQMLYNPEKKNIGYYRRYYTKFLNSYKFDLEELYYQSKAKSNDVPVYQQIKIDLKGKNFMKGLHDTYLDDQPQSTLHLLESNDWYGDTKILRVIDMLEFVREYANTHVENILSSSMNQKELKERIIKLQMQITDFRYPDLSLILDNIASGLYPPDDQTLIEIKSQIHAILKQYRASLTKKITRLVFIRNSDVSICNMLEVYMQIHANKTQDKSQDKISINIYDLEPQPSIEPSELQITNAPADANPDVNPNANPNGYYVSGTETVMINSDLLVNYNINLKKMAKILKKKGLFNTYDPDEHSGVNLKYYWNKANINNEEGICRCSPHCSTKEKKSICNKITILIFRPGSIVITGSRNLAQLCSAHDFTIKLLKETMDEVRIDEKTDDTKHIALLNNEARKISRKPRLFYIKRENIRYVN